MTTVIKAYGPITHPDTPIDGQYLESYDPEAYDGRGDVSFTQDIRKAMRFSNTGEAMAFAMQTSKKRPLRPDGKPNKPLTAFHLMFEPEPINSNPV